MTDPVEPAEDDETFLDATVGLEPSLIEAEPQQAPADRCVVDDDHQANSVLRTLGQLDAQKRERAAVVAAEMERLQAWQAHEDRQATRFTDDLTMLLRPYDDQLKAEGRSAPATRAIACRAAHSRRVRHRSTGRWMRPRSWRGPKRPIPSWYGSRRRRPGTLSSQSSSRRVTPHTLRRRWR
jgi:hypothetical protein